MEPEGQLEQAAGEAAMDAPAAGDGQEEGWTFPVFVGHRRRLAPDDVLFETGNEERGELAKQAARSVARDAQGQLAKESQLSSRDLASYLSHKFECATCHASLPTAHLLSCHISELHDSFFAAQAARRMRVYCCLVEGCARKFCTVEERKQHLVDHHRFPRNYNFDRIHLRRKKAQIRPLPQYRKGHGRKGMESEEGAEGPSIDLAAATAAAGNPGSSVAAAVTAGQAGAGAGADWALGAQAHAPAGPPHEHVLAGLSRLSVAARDTPVPQVASFGRHGARGWGMVRGRGRGLRGQGGSPHVRARGQEAPPAAAAAAEAVGD